jgi:hypothetical protein
MSTNYDPPIKVTIPTPGTFTIGYGPHSTGGRGGNMRARCTNKEYELLEQEAAALGITLANFVRWSAWQVARQLHKHRTEQMTSDEIGIEDDECRKTETSI